jgi:membrane protein YqaA with SNARE-associated domain
MSTLDAFPVSWLIVACFGGAIVSALLPWVNAELLMLSALPLATAHGELVQLVFAVTGGQMVGKSVMYWLSREGTGSHARRFQSAVEWWRGRFQRHPRSALVLVLVSALLGFPPFYAVSIAAGAFKMHFGGFLAAGSAGRLAHFAVIAYLPHVAGIGI